MEKLQIYSLLSKNIFYTFQFIIVAAFFAVAAASEAYEKAAPVYSAPAYEEVTYVSSMQSYFNFVDY